MKLKCLIVDDEPIARQIVEKYCSHLPEIEVAGSCGDALQAKQIVQQQKVDLVFLDINMPVLDGLGFVKTLKEPPLIIFTTAYKEFAHEAFDVNACDYLLKPFSLERFIIAIEKAKEKLNGVPASQTSTETGASHFIYVKSEGKLFKVDFSNLCYAEAKGNNVKVVTDDGVIAITTTFSNFETQIPKSQFIRIHRSFIVNRSKIRLIEGNRVFIGDSEIPIGMNYREDFLKAIGVK